MRTYHLVRLIFLMLDSVEVDISYWSVIAEYDPEEDRLRPIKLNPLLHLRVITQLNELVRHDNDLHLLYH